MKFSPEKTLVLVIDVKPKGSIICDGQSLKAVVSMKYFVTVLNAHVLYDHDLEVRLAVSSGAISYD